MSLSNTPFPPGPLPPDVPLQNKWELLKPFIVDQYINHKVKLSELMQVIKTRHGFDASEAQYKYQINRKWQLTKILTSAKKDLICKKLQRGNDRPAVVEHLGQNVNAKLRRHLKNAWRQIQAPGLVQKRENDGMNLSPGPSLAFKNSVSSYWPKWPDGWEKPEFQDRLRNSLENNDFSSVKVKDLPVAVGHIAAAAEKSPEELLAEAVGFSILGHNAELLREQLESIEDEDLDVDLENLYPFHLAASYLDGAGTCCEVFEELMLRAVTGRILQKTYENRLGHTVLDNFMITILKSHTYITPGHVEDSWKNEKNFVGVGIDICGRWDSGSTCFRRRLERGKPTIPKSWKHKFCHTSIQTICHCIRVLFGFDFSPPIDTPSGLFVKRCLQCGIKLQPRPLHTLVLTAAYLGSCGFEGEDLFGILACLLCLLANGADPTLTAEISASALAHEQTCDSCDQHEEITASDLAQRIGSTFSSDWSSEVNTGWQAVCYVLRSSVEERKQNEDLESAYEEAKWDYPDLGYYSIYRTPSVRSDAFTVDVARIYDSDYYFERSRSESSVGYAPVQYFDFLDIFRDVSENFKDEHAEISRLEDSKEHVGDDITPPHAATPLDSSSLVQRRGTRAEIPLSAISETLRFKNASLCYLAACDSCAVVDCWNDLTEKYGDFVSVFKDSSKDKNFPRSFPRRVIELPSTDLVSANSNGSGSPNAFSNGSSTPAGSSTSSSGSFSSQGGGASAGNGGSSSGGAAPNGYPGGPPDGGSGNGRRIYRPPTADCWICSYFLEDPRQYGVRAQDRRLHKCELSHWKHICDLIKHYDKDHDIIICGECFVIFPDSSAKTRHNESVSHCTRCYQTFPKTPSDDGKLHHSTVFSSHSRSRQCNQPPEKGKRSRDEFRWYKLFEAIHGHSGAEYSPYYLEARTSSEPAAQSSNELHRMCAESTSEPSDLNEVIKRQESIIASLTAKLAEKDRHFNSVLESMNVMHQVIQGSQLMHGTAHSIPTGNVQGSLNAFEPSPAPCFNATYPQPGLPIATSTAFGAIHSTGPPFDLSVNDFTPPTALPAAENTTSLREQADQTRPPNGSQKRPASPEASRSRKAIKVSAANQGSRPTLDQPSSSSREVDILSQMSLAKDTWHDLDDDNALKLLDPLQDVLNANFEWEFH